MVGMAVGAPFAVLVAEQLAASGAELVLSITSASHIGQLPRTPCFVLFERALRDEGTSVHDQPPGRWSRLAPRLRERLDRAFDGLPEQVLTGASWTTDAPYRETADQIAAAHLDGAVCVEMEVAALYAYATARDRQVVCLAHVTNTMATQGPDFEKGPANGVHTALAVAGAVARALVDQDTGPVTSLSSNANPKVFGASRETVRTDGAAAVTPTDRRPGSRVDTGPGFDANCCSTHAGGGHHSEMARGVTVM